MGVQEKLLNIPYLWNWTNLLPQTEGLLKGVTDCKTMTKYLNDSNISKIKCLEFSDTYIIYKNETPFIQTQVTGLPFV